MATASQYARQVAHAQTTQIAAQAITVVKMGHAQSYV
jgi:hypothetical protein